MRVAFRVDASVQIGSGHVMRCLTLAEQLRERGALVLFICRELAGNLNDLIAGKRLELYPLPAVADPRARLAGNHHAGWLGVTWEQDARETLLALETHGGKWDWVVVDNYALDIRWEETIRERADKVMVIDDLADRRHDCDLVLDQNLYEGMDQRYKHLVPAKCQLLAGPKYALLRPEFARFRQLLSDRSGVVRRILVFYGGSDATNETAKALIAIREARLPGIEVDVVVGAGNPNKGEIKKLCSALQGAHFHCQVDNMAELMAAADLMLCAGGTTTWERCSVGLPGLVMATAANQEDVADYSARMGLSFYLGPAASVSAQRLGEALRVWAHSPQGMRLLSATGLAAVDGKGVQRVARILMPLKVTLRRAILEDCDAIYGWRNAEETRRYIFDQEPIPLEQHRAWYRRTIENSDRVMLIGEVNDKPVGVLRYDLSGDEALISVYLVPGGQGQGVGAELICSGSNWLRRNRPSIRVIKAEIFRVNLASIGAFEQAGYHEHHVTFQKVLQ